MIQELIVPVKGKGLYNITEQIKNCVANCSSSDGLLTIFIRHTSASLLIQENADPAVQEDLNNWMDRLVPENDPIFTHVQEGPDDMPAHIKSALTNNQISLSVKSGNLLLGTWQGIYLFEHRLEPHKRKLIHHFIGD